ncbi:hypothetical protein H7Y21_02280 [Arenimonas sp.]|nr:hypothetical protein [Candidatus Parcubacteria bacterium]
MDTVLPIAPPYQIALFPRTDDSVTSQTASSELAATIVRTGTSKTNMFELIDFEYDFQQFLKQPGLPHELQNEAQFIEASIGKILKPGVITLMVNFDIGDLFLLMSILECKKPDLRVLLVVTREEFDKSRLADRPANIDCCIHRGAPTKEIMEKLGMIGNT